MLVLCKNKPARTLLQILTFSTGPLVIRIQSAPVLFLYLLLYCCLPIDLLLLCSCQVVFNSATPWMAAYQASLSFTISWSLLRLHRINDLETRESKHCHSNLSEWEPVILRVGILKNCSFNTFLLLVSKQLCFLSSVHTVTGFPNFFLHLCPSQDLFRTAVLLVHLPLNHISECVSLHPQTDLALL